MTDMNFQTLLIPCNLDSLGQVVLGPLAEPWVLAEKDYVVLQMPILYAQSFHVTSRCRGEDPRTWIRAGEVFESPPIKAPGDVSIRVIDKSGAASVASIIVKIKKPGKYVEEVAAPPPRSSEFAWRVE